MDMLPKRKLNNIDVHIVKYSLVIDTFMEHAIMVIVNMKKQEEINVINAENYAML